MRRVRVASPCSASWEQMQGDARSRFCGECKLNVFNFAEMSRGEVDALLQRSKGGVCARLYQRADGTFLTRDCPTGLRALRLRVGRAATAAIAALLALSACAFGRAAKARVARESTVAVTTTPSTASSAPVLQGVVMDEGGAMLPGVSVDLTEELTGKVTRLYTNADGAFATNDAMAGLFTLRADLGGLIAAEVQHVQLSPGTLVNVQVTMRHDEELQVLMGAVAPIVNTSDSSTTTVITREMIERLPH